MRQARACYASDPAALYVELCECLANEPLIAELAPDWRWNVPLRVLAALNYLSLDGRAPELTRAFAGECDPSQAAIAVLRREREWIADFLRNQMIQTNEVGRCYGLLPAFLLAAAESGRELDLIELGPSAGFNLFWDRYRYRYGTESWGDPQAPIELAGELRAPLPPGLLSVRPVVRSRLGIDLYPVDVTNERGARLMRCFIWPDQNDRLERLDKAIEVVAANPPDLIEGDYVELLERTLEQRSSETLTVVFQTASLFLLGDEQRAEVERILERAGERAPLAFVSGEHPPGRSDEPWQLRYRLWPSGEPRILARMDYHGRWLEPAESLRRSTFRFPAADL